MTLHPVRHDVPRVLTTLSKPIPRGTGEHVARLIRWFEATFDCREGLKRAWTYVPATTAEMQRIKALEATEGVPGAWSADDLAFNTEFFNRGRGVYSMFGYAAEGLDKEEVLCDAIYAFFCARLAERVALVGDEAKEPMYWRRKVEFRAEKASPAYIHHGAEVWGAHPDRCAVDFRAYFPTLTGLDAGPYLPDGSPIVYLDATKP